MIGNWKNSDCQERLLIEETREDSFVISPDSSSIHLLISHGQLPDFINKLHQEF